MPRGTSISLTSQWQRQYPARSNVVKIYSFKKETLTFMTAVSTPEKRERFLPRGSINISPISLYTLIPVHQRSFSFALCTCRSLAKRRPEPLNKPDLSWAAPGIFPHLWVLSRSTRKTEQNRNW